MYLPRGRGDKGGVIIIMITHPLGRISYPILSIPRGGGDKGGVIVIAHTKKMVALERA